MKRKRSEREGANVKKDLESWRSKTYGEKWRKISGGGREVERKQWGAGVCVCLTGELWGLFTL